MRSEKINQTFEPFIEKDQNNINKAHLSYDMGIKNDPSKAAIAFSTIIIPFYLPNLKDKNEISKLKQSLATDCRNNSDQAISLKLRKEKTRLFPRISQKYSFPWGLTAGIFEKFSTNCIINTSLYYKVHFKNFIHASNEDKDIE